MKVTNQDVINFYNSAAWKQTREAKLAENPLCQASAMSGQVDVVAVGVHHMLPIRTHWEKRFDMKFLLSLCIPCHTSMEDEIRREKARGASNP